MNSRLSNSNIPSFKELEDIRYALDVSAIVAITDDKGDITYVNDMFCQISQYSREELLGQNHRLINSGHHPRSFFRTMWRTISNGKVWKGEVKNKAKDGSFYWVDTTIVPFLDESGKPYKYISIRKEITDRKRVEEEIRQLNEEMEQRIYQRTTELQEANKRLSLTLSQLRESEKLKDNFIASLTHDLRTPLLAQKRASEMLVAQKESLPSKLARLTEHLLKSNEDLLSMVNLLLETYQYDEGKFKLQLEPMQLQGLISSCFTEVMPLAETKKIDLINHLPQDLPPVSGDAAYLKRVFMNLIGNALENIAPGCHIEITGHHYAPFVTAEVRDNGPGIHETLLPHLFERYYIGDQTRQKIGTGLGLYICRVIMEQHQGSIRVDSQAGKGTSFFLSLPQA